VIDGESEGGDCDEVMCAGWGEPGGEFLHCEYDGAVGTVLWNVLY